MIKLIALLCMLYNSSNSGIYDYSVPKIEGGSQSLFAYASKRLLVVTLPVQSNGHADSLLYSLDTLAAAHQATHQVIAVPAIEDGFSAANKTILQQWYRSKLGSYVLITDGLYTRKTSGEQQHNIFQWLTRVSNNQKFDRDVEGPGQQFYVKPNNKLYGMLHADFPLWSLAAFKVLTTPDIIEETE
jgi:glutathione peroxidase-family protein